MTQDPVYDIAIRVNSFGIPVAWNSRVITSRLITFVQEMPAGCSLIYMGEPLAPMTPPQVAGDETLSPEPGSRVTADL